MTMWWIFCRWKIRLPSVFNHKNNTRYCIRVGLKPKAKNKGDDEIGRFTPSNWPKSQNEAQETDCYIFSRLFNHFVMKQT